MWLGTIDGSNHKDGICLCVCIFVCTWVRVCRVSWWNTAELQCAQPCRSLLKLSYYRCERLNMCALYTAGLQTHVTYAVSLSIYHLYTCCLLGMAITRLWSRNLWHNTSVTPLSFSSHRSQLRLMPTIITLTLNSGKWLPYGFHMHPQSTSLVHEYVVLTSWHHMGWDFDGPPLHHGDCERP